MTAGVALEDLVLSEMSQAEKDKYWVLSFIVEFKSIELTETECRMVVTRGWVAGKMGRSWSRGTSFWLLDE